MLVNGLLTWRILHTSETCSGFGSSSVCKPHQKADRAGLLSDHQTRPDPVRAKLWRDNLQLGRRRGCHRTAISPRHWKGGRRNHLKSRQANRISILSQRLLGVALGTAFTASVLFHNRRAIH
ncbi:hypothetical protein BHE74_00031374 [Ensete ventricosum]|nr:hypothetical protein BHE74_00031374 [Ensete ventricosum]RZR84752.1 hypothetical protein BHM03_00011622 [Ensete ventricosum]